MTKDQFAVACATLSAVIPSIVKRITKMDYITFKACDKAPSTYAELVAAFKQAHATDGEYPVFSGGCDKTIYTSPEINHAFRFWHDWTHFKLGTDFSVAGEERTGLQMIATLSDWTGLDRGHVRNVLYADAIGQVYYFDANGKFPEDQRAFVFDFVNAKYTDGTMGLLLDRAY